MKIIFRLLFWAVIFCNLEPVAAQTDSVISDLPEESTGWPSALNRNGELSKQAIAYGFTNDTFSYYLCVPYTYWVTLKPFVAVDLYDPFTPPEYAIIKMPSNNNLLIFIVLLNVMFIIAIIKLSNERNLLSFVSSLYSNVSAVKYYGDRNTLFNRVNMQLLFVQLLMVSLGIALYRDFPLSLPDSTLIRFLILFAGLFGVILMKILINWSIEKIFEINRLSVIVTNHTIGINFVATLVMLPVFLVVYLNSGMGNADFLPVFATAVIIISLFVRVFRSFMMLNLSFPYPKVYLLLYFCTAEIIPWLIVFKLISS